MAHRHQTPWAIALVLCAATANFCVAQNARPENPSAAKSAAAKKSNDSPRKPPVLIGTDTTRIVQPLRPDGYPDYFAALDNHCRRGVTTDGNAAVLLVQAFGPDLIPQEICGDYFKSLGIQPLAPVGDYFVHSDELLQRWIQGAARTQDDDRDEGTLQSQFSLAG